MEEFKYILKYLGVLSTSEGRSERQIDSQIDRQIGATSVVMWSLYRYVVVRSEMEN